MNTGLYEVLGIDRDATADEIKKAHRRLVMKHHPDKGGDRKRFEQIQFAFEVLSDEKRRKRYDETGHADNHPEQDAIDGILAMAKGAFCQDNDDPIKVIESTLDKDRAGLRQQQDRARKAIRTMTANLNRFRERVGDGEGDTKSLIIVAVEDNIRAAEHDVAELEKRIEFCTKQLALLNGLRGPSSDYFAATQWTMPIRLDF